MVYRSKKDLWLFGLVWGAVLAPLVFGLFNVLGGNAEPGERLIQRARALRVHVFNELPQLALRGARLSFVPMLPGLAGEVSPVIAVLGIDVLVDRRR